MSLPGDLRHWLEITRAHGIMRRYFVVNGFDGALTMLGLIIGFMVGGSAELSVIITACLGAAIALGVSGVSSAYVSESAERRRALDQLEQTMLTDLRDTSHGRAARWVPVLSLTLPTLVAARLPQTTSSATSQIALVGILPQLPVSEIR